MISSTHTLFSSLIAMLKRGKTVADVNDSRRRVFMNQSLKPDPDTKEKIKWSPDAHSFLKGEIMTTVTEHYRDSYGISLVSDLTVGRMYFASRLICVWCC